MGAVVGLPHQPFQEVNDFGQSLFASEPADAALKGLEQAALILSEGRHRSRGETGPPPAQPRALRVVPQACTIRPFTLLHLRPCCAYNERMASVKTTGVTVRTRTTRRLAGSFARAAEREGRSVAEQLRRLMEQFVRDHDAPKEGSQ